MADGQVAPAIPNRDGTQQAVMDPRGTIGPAPLWDDHEGTTASSGDPSGFYRREVELSCAGRRGEESAVRGSVIGFDPDTQTGAVSGADGARYDFAAGDLQNLGPVGRGDRVEFMPDGGRARRIALLQTAYAKPSLAQFYFSPRQRISRSQYWLNYFLPVFGIAVALRLAAVIHGEAPREGAFVTVVNVFYLAALWPSIAALVKRMHDRDRSGWLSLLFYIPLFIGLPIAMFAVYLVQSGDIHDGNQWATFGAAFLGAAGLIGIWFFIEFGCMRGTAGANRYGADPLGPQR
jgi:uncharacterized membrane protein YhaH (DUF805 family)